MLGDGKKNFQEKREISKNLDIGNKLNKIKLI